MAFVGAVRQPMSSALSAALQVLGAAGCRGLPSLAVPPQLSPQRYPEKASTSLKQCSLLSTLNLCPGRACGTVKHFDRGHSHSLHYIRSLVKLAI